jgi:hypothetical protein
VAYDRYQEGHQDKALPVCPLNLMQWRHPFPFQRGKTMKQRYKKLLGAVLILTSVLLVLDGCGGYASYPQDTNSGASGVQVYGTVDAGVAHTSR